VTDLGGRRVAFGPFVFDLEARELKRDGADARLQAQPAQVLAVLVQRAGTVVTREELRAAVWGDDTHVDFDKGLNFAIAQVRAALRDSAETPRFVRTHPKRGYEFIAPVRELPDAHQDDAMAEPLVERPQPGSSRRAMVAVLAAAVLAMGLAVTAGHSWRAARLADRERQRTIAVVPFDNETGQPAMDRYARDLSDLLVAQLTTSTDGRYRIIGNAAILRRPRAERDIREIGRALHAGFIVIGQVQEADGRPRILAHLIRLPEQTHVSVVRVERRDTTVLPDESELARQITSQFVRRLAEGVPLTVAAAHLLP
jgi:DNA-binding winged helix-turn-helix (wHTH) protein/TolB-like protein